MKISALRLFNVKRFAGRGIAIEGIGDGVNVLCAANEFGKSTSFESLHALFFQPHSSTAGPVRDLRPYSGGNPLIEGDISTANGAFRITKQFYGKGSARVVDLANGRLVAQADEAESFIASLVRGGTAGPAGLLWVRQGITGIEKRSKSDEESETKVRAGLLQSVQGEVEAVTGGRRMAEILSATEEELDKLVTAGGRPKTGERYGIAIAERDRLRAEEARLRAEVERLREALDKRGTALKNLAELDSTESRDERRQALESAQTAFDLAKTRSDALRIAEAELKLVREQRDNAHRELKDFSRASDRGAALAREIKAAELKLDEALADRDAAASNVAEAYARVETAEKVEDEANALFARLEAALKARDAAMQLAGLEEKLEAAETVRKVIEEQETALVLLRLPDKAVSELETLDIDIAALNAVAEAARPSVTIAYEPGAPLVSLDGEPLKDGEQRRHRGQAMLAIPGVGTITMHSNHSESGDDRLREAGERRRVLLLSLGVVDLGAARRRQVEAQQKEADLRENRTRLSLLAPEGLAKLRELVSAHRAEQGDGVLELKEDPVQARVNLEAVKQGRIDARAAWRAAEPRQDAASNTVISAQAGFARLDAERSQIEAIIGPGHGRAERENELSARLDDLDSRLTVADSAVAGLRLESVDLSSADANLRRHRSVADAAEKQIGALREEIAGLNAHVATQSDLAVEEKWRETAEALEAVERRVSGYAKEVAILSRLQSALTSARSDAREAYLLPVMSELRPLLGLLFDDVSITFDEKTLLPHRILRRGQEEDVDRLSGGMREQLSVLTRLAFARLLAKDGRPAPVILDDALVYSDDDRIERMFDVLHRQAHDQQIIVFSCRQRAFQKLGGNVLHVSDWTPEV